MGILSSSLVQMNLNFAISNMSVTLEGQDDYSGKNFTANKQSLDEAFVIFESGREATVDTRFYVKLYDSNGDAIAQSDTPTKGWVFKESGTTNFFKVNGTSTDPTGNVLRLDCESRYQR